MNCSCWRALGVIGGVVFVAPALAAAPIEWEAPERCPSRQVVEEKLREALGHEVNELGTVSRVRGTIITESTGHRLTLELVDAGRRSLRSFQAQRCEDLAGAAALAIALAVHPASAPSDAAAAPNAPARVEEAALAPRAEPMPSDRGGDAEVSGASEAWVPSWSAGLSGVLDVGALPDPAAGIGMLVRARIAPLELDVHGLLLPSQPRGVGDSESVDFGLMAAGLRACLRVMDGGLVVGACLGVEAGRFTAAGVGLSPGREARDPWLAVGPAMLGRTAFAGPLQLELLVEPLLPLARKQYAVDATDVVHSPGLVDIRLQLGLIIGSKGPTES